MKNVLRSGAAAAALLIFAGGAMAQAPDWYHHREERYHGERWRARLFAEVREDLNHVQATTFPGRDRYRIARTERELNELQADLAAGRYEEPKLDEVIGALHRVVSDNHLSPRDRDVLHEDLRRLREYREHHDGWMHQ